MRIAYFDTIAGISGDMTLGALVSAGLPFDTLDKELRKLPVGGFEIEARHQMRNGITAVKIDVTVSDDSRTHRHLRDIE
ncbi:MAG: nickel insertion protein, partial [Bacteroidota bacterium]